MQYAVLELPKYEAGDAPETLIDKWAFFFREAKNLDVVPPALANEPFRGALEVARTAGFSADEWEAYERAKMAEQDARGALSVTRQEGHKSAVADGKRDALLRLISRRGLALTEEERTRIVECTDEETLEQWFDNALVAASAAEALS